MTCFLYGLIFSYLSDVLIRKNYLKTRTLRYFGVGIGLGVPGITVAVLGYTTNSWILCISVLSIGIGFGSASYMGHLAAVYDISPTYSGTVYGFVNMVGNTTGFITPLVASYFTENDPHDVTGWRNLFWLSAGLYFSGTVIFPILIRIRPAEFEPNTNQPNYQHVLHGVKSYGTTENCDIKC